MKTDNYEVHSRSLKIKRNIAQCLNCNEIIESTHRHHFVSCKCGDIFVDGGKDYLRRGYIKLENIRELSEYEEEGV